jgi:hypothetical protein
MKRLHVHISVDDLGAIRTTAAVRCTPEAQRGACCAPKPELAATAACCAS